MQLITGEGESQITWHLNETQRKKEYFNSSLEYVTGDSIYIKGDGTANSRTLFQEKKFPFFQLEDGAGHAFDIETHTLDGNGLTFSFTVYFKLSQDGSINENIKSGEDLKAVDPSPSQRGLPGHIVNLDLFDDISP
ncbi:MAG: hypothetical protein M1539_04390 [Actinobacteria bacterium]|nr:hypothetical protein [Actinomycetota bacterium]